MNLTPGMKTSEFGLSVGTIISVVLADLFDFHLDPVTIAAIVGACMAYVNSRGNAKTEPRG